MAAPREMAASTFAAPTVAPLDLSVLRAATPPMQAHRNPDASPPALDLEEVTVSSARLEQEALNAALAKLHDGHLLTKEEVGLMESFEALATGVAAALAKLRGGHMLTLAEMEALERMDARQDVDAQDDAVAAALARLRDGYMLTTDEMKLLEAVESRYEQQADEVAAALDMEVVLRNRE